MATLFDQMIAAHRKVGTIEFETSSAATSAVINSQLRSSATADDIYIGGTLFFSTVGSFARITDYDASSGQWSFSTGILSSTTVGSVISFGYTTPEFPHELVIELANDALRAAGPLVYVDRANIVSSAGQSVYNLPANTNYDNLFRVDVLGRTGSTTDDPQWFTVHDWEVIPSSAGGTYLLIFKGGYLPSGREVRVWYYGHHPRVDVSTASLDQRIHPELAILLLVEKMYEYRNSRARGAEDFDIQRWNDAKQQVAEARVRWPMWEPRRKPKFMIPGYTPARDTQIPGPSTGVTS